MNSANLKIGRVDAQILLCCYLRTPIIKATKYSPGVIKAHSTDRHFNFASLKRCLPDCPFVTLNLGATAEESSSEATNSAARVAVDRQV